jgi:hypothetical protein
MAYLISTSAVMLQTTRDVAPTRSASDGGAVKMEANTYKGEVPTSPCSAAGTLLSGSPHLALMSLHAESVRTCSAHWRFTHIHDAQGAECQPQRPRRLAFLQCMACTQHFQWHEQQRMNAFTRSLSQQ